MFGTCEFPRFWTLSRLNYDVSRHAMLGNERKWICTVCAVFDNDRVFLIKSGGSFLNNNWWRAIRPSHRGERLARRAYFGVFKMFRDFFDRA
jgi:hypothetical protein